MAGSCKLKLSELCTTKVTLLFRAFWHVESRRGHRVSWKSNAARPIAARYDTREILLHSYTHRMPLLNWPGNSCKPDGEWTFKLELQSGWLDRRWKKRWWEQTIYPLLTIMLGNPHHSLKTTRYIWIFWFRSAKMTRENKQNGILCDTSSSTRQLPQPGPLRLSLCHSAPCERTTRMNVKSKSSHDLRVSLPGLLQFSDR